MFLFLSLNYKPTSQVYTHNHQMYFTMFMSTFKLENKNKIVQINQKLIFLLSGLMQSG